MGKLDHTVLDGRVVLSVYVVMSVRGGVVRVGRVKSGGVVMVVVIILPRPL
jgi:hypothetical protein